MSGTAVSAPGPLGDPACTGRGGLGFVSPFLIVFGLFMIVPLGYAVYDSLFTSRIIGGTAFSGFSNLCPLIVMGGLVTIAPLIVLFLILQRYWRSGMLLGSIAN